MGAGALAFGIRPRLLRAQAAGVQKLAENLYVIDADGANVVVLASGQDSLMVDSGPASADNRLSAALGSLGVPRVSTLFNTHYHTDQTGNNELFHSAGTEIVAQERTRQWMATEHWVMDEDRYEGGRPKAALPTKVFLTEESMNLGGHRIDCGHLTLAHTSGDIYVFFRDANVVAVGDVASPERDPSLDWFTGAWIGGRVDAMDDLLNLMGEQTKVVPAYGPVMTKAEFQAERDMMEEFRGRAWTMVREGDGPEDMLEKGVLDGLGRTWKDPYKFVYATCKGLWAHHNKLDHNVV